MVAHGTPCLGPVTHAGCGALCPTYDRGCYGCFGPDGGSPTPAALGAWLAAPRPARARRRAPVPDLLRGRAGVPRCERAPAMADRVLLHRGARPGRGRGRDARARCATAASRTCGCGSTSRRASSRRSCAAGAFTEVPDITARICGICPVAYQMSSIAAMEDACGVEVPDAVRDAAAAAVLRRVDREPRAARLPAARARTSSATTSAFDDGPRPPATRRAARSR